MCIATILVAQDEPSGKVHGYVFGDYFYKIGGNAAEVSSSQYSKAEKDFQGFQFRRLYLYYDHTFDQKFSAQFLLEGNDKVLDPAGKHGVFIKTAYLEIKDILPLASLSLGLVPTPTWSLLSEKVWNYRSIEKTITDFRGLGNASDIGLLLHGIFDVDGMFGYHVMIGNGNGQKPEINKYKKYYAALFAKPMKELILEGYVDYEPAASDLNKMTLKGFAAYQSSAFTFGVEFVQQTQQNAGGKDTNRVPLGIAVFAWAPLPIVDALNAFVRYDLYNPDTKITDKGYKEGFMTVGLDYMPIPNVHIMPNVWINTFSAKSSGEKDADVVGRVTFFYIYK